MKILAFLLLFPLLSFAQDHKPAYKLFSKDAKEVSYSDMIKELAKADVILFGELHDNAISHWLELQVTEDLHARKPELVLGMEMFEADDQIILDEYLNGVIEERHLLAEAKVWENYKRDYQPLVEFAKAKKLPVVATNIPRRYANLVYRKGLASLETLPSVAKAWMMPLPVEVDLSLPGYKDMISMMSHDKTGNGENMAASQAVKDATMAHFIVLQHRPQGLFLHFNGAYHSRNYEGIVWYLKKMSPGLKILTIHSAEQETIDQLEDGNKNTADFIIGIPSDMTKTY